MLRHHLRTLLAAGPLWLGLAWLASPAPARADLVLVRGFVRDTQGRPIFNADFNVYDSATGEKLAASDKSDATGAYKLILDPGRYDLLCQVKDPNVGFAPRIQRGVLVSGNLSLDFTLPPSEQMRGRVFVAEDNSAVYPCNLDLDRTDDGARQPSLGNATSPFGTFIDYIEAGSYIVTANPADTTLAPARVYGWVVPTADILSLPVERAAFLSGTIRESNGAPVEGVILRFDDEFGVRHPGTKSPSDASGFFRVGVKPGVYRVTVEPKASANLASIRVPGVDLTASTSRDFTLPVGVAVSGRVSDKLGFPVAGADWDAILERTNVTAATPTDNTTFDGTYRYVVEPGIYRLKLTPPAASGLDTLFIEHVALLRDTTINVDYAALGSGGGSSSPVVRFESVDADDKIRNPTHRTARLLLVLSRPVQSALVEIYDVTGSRVQRLHSGGLPAGSTHLQWSGERDNGAQAHTGVYFVRARLDGHEGMARFILLP